MITYRNCSVALPCVNSEAQTIVTLVPLVPETTLKVVCRSY